MRTLYYASVHSSRTKSNKQVTATLNDLAIILCRTPTEIQVMIFLPTIFGKADIEEVIEKGDPKLVVVFLTQLQKVTVSYQCCNKGFMEWRDRQLWKKFRDH